MAYVALQAQSCVVLSEINVHNFCKKVAFVYFHIVLPSRPPWYPVYLARNDGVDLSTVVKQR